MALCGDGGFDDTGDLQRGYSTCSFISSIEGASDDTHLYVEPYFTGSLSSLPLRHTHIDAHAQGEKNKPPSRLAETCSTMFHLAGPVGRATMDEQKHDAASVPSSRILTLWQRKTMAVLRHSCQTMCAFPQDRDQAKFSAATHAASHIIRAL